MGKGLQHVKGMKRMAVIDGHIVPGRDLTAEEVKKYGGRGPLIASGLYKPYPKSKKSTPVQASEE